MADKLHFSLVSPERELFSGAVDGVDVPGEEGDFGVLPNHAPVMTAIRPGAITIFDGTDKKRIYIRGGFADVTPQGLIILAEEAIDLATLDADAITRDVRHGEEDVRDAKDEDKRAAARTRLDHARALLEALNGA